MNNTTNTSLSISSKNDPSLIPITCIPSSAISKSNELPFSHQLVYSLRLLSPFSNSSVDPLSLTSPFVLLFLHTPVESNSTNIHTQSRSFSTFYWNLSTSFSFQLEVSSTNFNSETELLLSESFQHLSLNSCANDTSSHVSSLSSSILAQVSDLFHTNYLNNILSSSLFLYFPTKVFPIEKEVEIFFTDAQSQTLITDPRLSNLGSLFSSLFLNHLISGRTSVWIPDILNFDPTIHYCAHLVSISPSWSFQPHQLSKSTVFHLKIDFLDVFQHFLEFKRDFLSKIDAILGSHCVPLITQVLHWIQQCTSDSIQPALIYGVSGIGKTYFAKTFAAYSKLPYHYVASCNSVQVLQHAFSCQYSPFLLILDDLDALDPIHADFLGSLLHACTVNKQKVLVLGLAKATASLDSCLQRMDRFGKLAWPFPSLTINARRHLLTSLSKPHLVSKDTLMLMCEKTHGWLPSDLIKLIALANAKYSNQRNDWETCVVSALESTQPSSLRSYSTKIPKVRFEDLCGLDSIIQDLKVSILNPFLKKSLFSNSLSLSNFHPFTLVRGIVIHGSPGTGKSQLAYAITDFLGLNCIAVDSTQLISKLVGESEKRIASLFETAKQSAPCLLLLDQLETLCAHRGSTSSSENSGDRMVATFLVELDRLVGCLVIATTNRIDLIDSAILRPGRLEHHIHLSLPDFDQRCTLLHHFSTLHNCEFNQQQIKELAEMTDQCSPADIRHLFHSAAMTAIRLGANKIEWKHFEKAKPVHH